MRRHKLPHVEQWRDRHGGRRYYFRIGKGPRTPLPPPGTDGFLAAYNAALGAAAPPARRGPSDDYDTISGLVSSYMRSTKYRSLRLTSRAGYLSRLNAIREQHGHRTVSAMTRERIVRMMDAYADRPGAAHAFLKMLRILIAHAIAINWLQVDPSAGIKRPKLGEVRSWTDEEIGAFEQRWPVGTKERLAFALFLCTGQRRSDIHRLTWAQVTDEAISFKQQKTGAEVRVPIMARLRPVLAKARRSRRHLTVLNTAFGRPFTVDGFGQWMRAAITQAGLPLACQPHGLRKATGRLLAEAGCSAHEIMAILGHRTLAEAERYTRDADRQGLAVSAIGKIEGRMARLTQTARAGLGKEAKSGAKSK